MLSRKEVPRMVRMKALRASPTPLTFLYPSSSSGPYQLRRSVDRYGGINNSNIAVYRMSRRPVENVGKCKSWSEMWRGPTDGTSLRGLSTVSFLLCLGEREKWTLRRVRKESKGSSFKSPHDPLHDSLRPLASVYLYTVSLPCLSNSEVAYKIIGSINKGECSITGTALFHRTPLNLVLQFTASGQF